jgi:hypothetical protein
VTDAQRKKLFNQALREQLRNQKTLVGETRDTLLRVLETIKAQLMQVLAAQPSDYQQWFLPQIQAQIETVLQGLQQQGAVILNQSLDNSAAAGLAQLDNALRPAGILLAGVAPQVDVALLTNIKRFHVNRIADITKRVASSIEVELSKVLIGGQSPFDAQKAIQALMSDAPTYRVKAIVRTSMASVYDKSANDRYQQASGFLPGLKKKWQRSGKREPRLSHYAAHGQVVPTDQPFQIGAINMMHPHDPSAPAREVINCGCTIVPFMESWDVIAPAQKTDLAA